MPRAVTDGGEGFDDVASRTSSHRRMDSIQHGHQHGHGYKVGFPPKKSLFAEFSDAVKETFFADDPLREYKDLPKSKKIWLGLQQVFPVLDWSRDYSLGKFKGDLIAGLTIASLCIPQVSEFYTSLADQRKHSPCTEAI
jgi:high affinity sulfate transporter 1